MWPRKRYAVVFLLGIGLLSAFFGASGQDQRLPWPPRPVQPPDTPITLDPPPLAATQNKLPESGSGPPPLVVPDANPIVRVSAQETVSPPPLVAPDSRVVLPDPPPPAPPPVVPPPSEAVKIVEKEPTGPMVPRAGSSPVVVVPEPQTKPDVLPPDLPIPKPALADTQPKPIALPSPGPIPNPISLNDGSRPLQVNPPPKTITINPSHPPISVPQLKEQPPEPPRPPAFRIVAPIRKQASALPDPPTLPPPSVPRETYAPPRPLTEERPPLSGTQTPLLTFEKRGPTAVQVNQSARFEIIIRNAGAVPAQKVQVEDDLPPGARFLGGDPQPILRGDRATWLLDVLAPGAERRLVLDLQATAAADWATNTTVTVSTTKAGRTNIGQTSISQSSLSLSMKGPAGAAVGQPVVFEIEMANNGSRLLSGLVLQATMPQGLTHPLGERIEADVSDLPPLTTKSFPLTTTATKPGRHTIQIKVTTSDGKEASAQAVVIISDAGVGIRPAGTSRLMLDREGDIEVELANYLDRPLRNVLVTDVLPEGVAFLEASDRGIYRSSSRSVYWMIDNLAAGQTKRLGIKVKPSVIGELTHQALAKTAEGQESKLAQAVVVESLPDLQVKLHGRDNPVEAGRQAVYEILVQNQGSAPATGVRVLAFVPEGMRPSSARGPTAYNMLGQQVAFEAVPRLDARKQMVFEVAALAQSAGDRRLRVQVTSDQVTVPIAREERTWVYVD